MIGKIGAISFLHSLRTLPWISSGPLALWGLIFPRRFSKQLHCMSFIWGLGLEPLSGIGVSVTGVNSLWNCWFRMFDLVCVSPFRIPFSLSGGIEEFSVFWVLIYENSFLGNFVKNGLSESETGMSKIMFSMYFQEAFLCSFFIFGFKDLIMSLLFLPDFLHFTIFFPSVCWFCVWDHLWPNGDYHVLGLFRVCFPTGFWTEKF